MLETGGGGGWLQRKGPSEDDWLVPLELALPSYQGSKHKSIQVA